jgi:hypothetical protein
MASAYLIKQTDNFTFAFTLREEDSADSVLRWMLLSRLNTFQCYVRDL